MKINLLDMGQTKYGDCILITSNDRMILVDGGHPGDTDSIRFQLSKILNIKPPFELDLLIVTHCHSDHIGCLPDLVSLGDISTKIALVADEMLGFGRDANDNGPTDAPGLSDSQNILIRALQEEDHSDLPDELLEQFLFDAARLEDQYKNMLKQLDNNGTQIIRYGKTSENKIHDLENQFSDFGLKILGPTKDHLILCANAIGQLGGGTDSIISSDKSTKTSTELINAYRSLTEKISKDALEGADRPGVGAAKNNQSIVLKVEADGLSALLAGDMQFAKPEISGLNDIMTELLNKANTEGPYNFIKLTHHSSYNGLNDDILTNWLNSTDFFAHTGGRHDADHPDKGVLQILKKYLKGNSFARTDRNGIITVQKSGSVEMLISKGRFNDFTPNKISDEETLTPEVENIVEKVNPEIIKTNEPEINSANYSISEEQNVPNGEVEIITKIPHISTKVTLTIEIETRSVKKKSEKLDILEKVDESDRFKGLLFITCSSLLERNIGTIEARNIITSIKNLTGVEFLEVSPSVKDAVEASKIVRSKIKAAKPRGIVIIGGYDVIPSNKLDTIDVSLRNKIIDAGKAGYDADDFIVWSDDIYGDSDGDLLPELPVTRIPDGRRADIIQMAMKTSNVRSNYRFGVRNLARPFADLIYKNIPAGNSSQIEISESFNSKSALPQAQSSSVYFMLHGSDTDGTRFWGETQGGDTYEAIHINNIPHLKPGTIVFTGCCWAGLTVTQTAYKKNSDTSLQPRNLEESIALEYIKAGALAFIGCTGTHYSPMVAPYDYFGKPMHDNFWKAISLGKSPAEALFWAKKEYAKKMPHGQTTPFSQAIEAKILQQYTCLGLGW